ncbi:MAG: hypothetical protein AB8G86_23675 [Saprospiraceae bacterium]
MKINISTAIILLIIIIVNFGCSALKNHKSRFKKRTVLEIKKRSSKVIIKNSIGNEWTFLSEVNDTIPLFWKSQILDVSRKTKLEIKSTAIENDPSIDDIGVSKIIITPKNLSKYLDKHIFSDTVFVHEYHGPSAGNTAMCYFEYELIKVRKKKNFGSE